MVNNDSTQIDTIHNNVRGLRSGVQTGSLQDCSIIHFIEHFKILM